MPISERESTPRQNIVQLIADALNARGHLYQPGGAVAVAEGILGEYERDFVCPRCGAVISATLQSSANRERPAIAR